MTLSPRLQAIANKVKTGDIVADIGTDHAYVPTFLLKNNKIPHAIACDINKKPLKKAESTLKKYNLMDKAELRLGSGLEPIEADEVDTVIIAGMGGELIARLLGEDIKKTRQIKKFIFQPMSQEHLLRQFLKDNHFKITSEQTVLEEDSSHQRFYTIITAKAGEMESFDQNDALFGYRPAIVKDKTYRDYLIYLIKWYKTSVDKMEGSLNPKTVKRRQEFLQRLDFLEGRKN